MLTLCVIFAPPLYFLARKKWGGFIISSFIYGFACLLLLSIIFTWLAPFVWLVSVVHASYYRRQERMVQHAELLATKMAEKMRETSQASQPPPLP